ncbi:MULTISPECIES: TetR/AcrR family transcriptional regulator [Myxococcus]|uniref:TetR/AcrR family transcriptional regulator n=1 Tax=Myxococcus llanfairpwllgwyngyllgogerychwyrndrobwllllantysiliogogogochensis TaxID=2590453 RepID=A0A540WR52_9BACT|nr:MULTISPECIES: TetR/AcrR family transcriptional regulator [Myxococcus]NTX00210.1 TetR/AcrR family transcriptional regulator [Myxococcus sp. CA040A]NTX15704.1 TetR/AcrR family transcriptional regulator [Myxococcus sp. CA056]NTX38330.1 TetR/AcrR family transcriptional regulator [Myxococcus sp. CA033]NTX53196.1 TetR/AcrR family transcriptional regulator [Myxococcus sp. CA039A]TQF11506.1 TetR/AcrR family transcriptional regulator [Myxococcus llanfairpwllgwyngyllgogerychwyrndrobwllllantysiliogogo
MGIKERREREKQATRQRILDAARELYVQEGYEAMTMRRVAEKIEYSATAIYVHFKDKAALIQELCAHDFLRFAEVLNKVAKVKDPVERLRKMGRAYIDFAQEYPTTYRLLFMERRPAEVGTTGPDGPEQGNPEQDAYAFLRQSVQEAKDADCFRPEHQDVELVSQALWGGLHGLVALHLVMGPEDKWIDMRPLMRTATLMMDLLLEGLCKPSRSGGATRAR